MLRRLNETLEMRKQRLDDDAASHWKRRRREKQAKAPKTPKERTSVVRAKKGDEEAMIELEELVQKQENMLIEGSHIQDEPTKPSEKQANRDLDQDCQDALTFVAL